MNRRDGLGAVGVTVHPGHAHAAEAEGGNSGAGRSEGAGVHKESFLGSGLRVSCTHHNMTANKHDIMNLLCLTARYYHHQR